MVYVRGLGFQVSGFGFRVQGFGVRVRVLDSGFRVYDSGFRVSGFGFRLGCTRRGIEGTRLEFPKRCFDCLVEISSV